MGRERRRPGKHVHVLAASVALLALAACGPIMQLRGGEGRCPHLQNVQLNIDTGDFDEALRVGQEVLERDRGGPAGDAAYFDLGLLNAHPGNPKKDYRKSLYYFSRLIKEYPKSPLVEESKVWVGVLESIEKSRRVDIEIEQKKKGINK